MQENEYGENGRTGNVCSGNAADDRGTDGNDGLEFARSAKLGGYFTPKE